MDVGMHLRGQQHASASACSFFVALCCATIFSTGTFFASVTLQGNVLLKEISYSIWGLAMCGATCLFNRSNGPPLAFA